MQRIFLIALKIILSYLLSFQNRQFQVFSGEFFFPAKLSKITGSSTTAFLLTFQLIGMELRDSLHLDPTIFDPLDILRLCKVCIVCGILNFLKCVLI